MGRRECSLIFVLCKKGCIPFSVDSAGKIFRCVDLKKVPIVGMEEIPHFSRAVYIREPESAGASSEDI